MHPLPDETLRDDLQHDLGGVLLRGKSAR
jgi:hypothetical protein